MLKNEEKKLLEKQLDDNFNFYKEGGVNYIEKMHDDAKEERQFTLNISVVCGAISAFTIPLVKELSCFSWLLVVFALICLFLIIVIGFVSLSISLDVQIKGHIDGFHTLKRSYSEFRDVIIESLNENDMKKYETYIRKIQDDNKKKVKKNENELFDQKWSYTKKIILTLLAASLTSIIVAVILNH